MCEDQVDFAGSHGVDTTGGKSEGSVALAIDERDFGRDECQFLKLVRIPVNVTDGWCCAI